MGATGTFMSKTIFQRSDDLIWLSSNGLASG